MPNFSAPEISEVGVGKHLDPASRALQEGGLSLLATKTARFVLNRISTVPAKRALNSRLAAAGSLDDYVDAIYSFRFRNVSVAPSQIRSEITGLLGVLTKSPPRVVLEIGTGLGGTTLLLARVAAQDATVITLDLPTGPSPQRLLDAGAREDQRIYAVRGDSHDYSTYARIQSLIGRQKVDVLFIDGDHSYEGVRADFRLYSPLVRSTGWIAFHDIAPGPAEFVGGVPQFWSELKRNHETHEFIENPEQQGLGIGLIRTGSP